MSPNILALEPLNESGVCQQAERRLKQSPYFFLRGIRCDFSAGVMTLRGTVPIEQLRLFAESIVSRVEGVRSVDNQVEVFDPMLSPIDGRAVRSAG